MPVRFDVLVTDRPPEPDSPAGTRAGAGAPTAACVLLLSGAVTGQPAPGVTACLPERSEPAALAAAVHLAALGARTPARPGDRAAAALSARERQVLRLVADGLTHDQAARRLGISRHTVDTYVKRVRAKLALGNKAELVRAAMVFGRD
ncbi:helix-turn-helix transcriptional regulator [Streptomyces sp. NBC_00158]|uniref:helix-turn-helix domain-containing protein n=1 Tax=Streptomyces sp. NBC_00158 TaxID=2903627 RepID=UPI0032507700